MLRRVFKVGIDGKKRVNTREFGEEPYFISEILSRPVVSL